MKRIFAPLLFYLALQTLSPSAMAEVIIGLSSTDDLSNLAVGQTVNFQVNLTGDYELAALAVQVEYDDVAFAASTLLPGSLITETEGFADWSFPGTLDGNYDNLFTSGGTTLSGSGSFYTFDLTVLQPTNSVISLVYAGLFDPSGSFTSLEKSDLATSLSVSASAAVPEPASFIICAIGCAAGPMLLTRRRTLKRQHPL